MQFRYEIMKSKSKTQTAFAILIPLVCFEVLVVSVASENVDSEEDMDAIINYLLNGESLEMETNNEIDDDVEPVLNGGIWKCGNCEDIDESRLIYSEVNDVDDMNYDQSVDIQVGVTLSNMKCVTVQASAAGLVRRVSGACSGPSVTLTVRPARHFTLQVYGD